MGNMELEGLVIKCVGGFYTVNTPEGPVTCRARGRFRKDGVSPCAGDQVRVQREPDGSWALSDVLPRRNHLVRPPVANLDRLFVVASLRDPAVNLALVDKTLAVAEINHIEPVVVFTKTDLGDAGPLLEIYRLAGIECCAVCAERGEGIERLRELAAGKLSAFLGNSGVGKSTLLNAAFPGLGLETGEISRKLGRGGTPPGMWSCTPCRRAAMPRIRRASPPLTWSATGLRTRSSLSAALGR